MPSNTYNGQSGWQKFNVPDGVTKVTVDLKGAGSGLSSGGRVRGTLKVRPKDTLFLLVGTAGGAASGRQGGAGGHGGGAPGGDADGGHTGGRGGGGAAAIRLNSTTGTIKVVAGGSGGKSGDDGGGGPGGGPTGGHGTLGTTSGGGAVGNSTGGTQIQGGEGGESSAGPLDGKDGQDQRLGTAGRGGQNTDLSTHGGGGGGGGFYPGGGGAAARIGQAAGGGGAGGSNYTGGLETVVSNEQGGGNTGNATIVLTWNSPPPANQPPSSPSDAKVNGKAEVSGMSTRSTGRVTISAVVRDPDATTQAPTHVGGPSTQRHQKARLLVRYSASSSFAHGRVERSGFVEYGKRAELTLTGLSQNTHYYLRLYAEDSNGKTSSNYNAVDFWTNRNPLAPVLQAPSDNATVLDTDSTTFDWAAKDPDDNDGQRAFTLRWRTAAQDGKTAGPWITVQYTTGFDNYVAGPGTFKAGVYYEWTVRTQDQQKQWGPYATPRSLFCHGATNPPLLTYPIRGRSVDVSLPVVLRWNFRDPTFGVSQTKADWRYRVVGTNDWVTVFGDTTVPGGDQQWEVPANTLMPGLNYEWSVRTYSTASPVIPTDWSEPEDFWTHPGINNLGASTVELSTAPAVLGVGRNRAFIYARGGQRLLGEITPLTAVTWGRKRDDVGEATVATNGFGADCGALLATVHTWTHELVIFRDGVRVFEGPITLIEDSVDGFTISAKDVMGYVYRRIMKQGYNDSFHIVQGVEEGLLTVVQRAGLIISDALARQDPNVLPYLTLLTYPDDARQSRSVPDYTKTAWEEVDDMAANAGLDYSVIGRRIILNDTHRPVGRLPEWRSAFFDQAPKISEYGMLLATEYAVTNGSGLWGTVSKPDSPYGLVELLVSSFSEVGGENGEVLTAAKEEAVRQALTDQAKRGAASRYPAPYIVRVPDNSRLKPDAPVDINQLVPGVWIPLRATGTVVEISQWQKLDAMQVTEASGDESVTVTLSPAPNSGQDPDADSSEQDAAAT